MIYLKRSGYLVLFLLILWIVINQVDEPIDPEVQALLDEPIDLPPDSQNAYIAHIGINGSTSEEMIANGEIFVAGYLEAADKKNYTETYEKNNMLEIPDVSVDLCLSSSPSDNDCLHEIHKNQTSLLQARSQLQRSAHRFSLQSGWQLSGV